MLKALDPCSGETLNVRFGEASRELLLDVLIHLSTQNKEKLNSLSSCCDSFKNRKLMGE